MSIGYICMKEPINNPDMNSITNNILQIRNRMREASIRANRNPDEVKLLLATKTVSAENINLSSILKKGIID